MNISAKELILKISQEKLNIFDIRDPYSFSKSHIPQAKNISSILLLNYPTNYLEKDKTYYIYCSFGSTSQNIANKLNRLGYTVINLTGGYINYLKESKV